MNILVRKVENINERIMTRKSIDGKEEASASHHRRRRGYCTANYCQTNATMHIIVMIIMLVIPCQGFNFVSTTCTRGRMIIRRGRIHDALRKEAVLLRHVVTNNKTPLTFQKRQISTTTQLFLVTEQDVLSAVEEAEALWAKALEARKTANALSDRAEEEAEAAASNAQTINGKLNEQRASQTPITMEQLAQADSVARSNLDAGSLVNRALRATEEADRLEQLAEAALQKSEAQLEQHLVDFPDSALAE